MISPGKRKFVMISLINVQDAGNNGHMETMEIACSQTGWYHQMDLLVNRIPEE
ncbi:hypothetical protein SLEP1_g23330 [Rubroshorea leprosula]|uniref:Uncharacterized protein n=1 Tax=Rubroshorea leprosula TaxID=152421 RepID=A0AAV5JJ85_9ROSI|nr:hypothetical protein SLEP1_g23330 [Rubroshorea leprosula]